MEKIYQFYLKKSVFIVSAIVAVLGWFSWCIALIALGNPVKLWIFALIFTGLTLGLLIAYLCGETNIQKMLMGALLLFFIIDYIEIADVYFQLNFIPTAVVSTVTLGILAVFFVCHLLQQMDHVGHGIIHVINQCCGFAILLCVAFLVTCLLQNIASATDFTFMIAMTFTLIMIICMETRIFKYKQMRAAYKANGEWDEENRKAAKELFKV